MRLSPEMSASWAHSHRLNIIKIKRQCRRFWSDHIVDQEVYVHIVVSIHSLDQPAARDEKSSAQAV